jgi:Holliday junction resolvase RusA-like endonuclease
MARFVAKAKKSARTRARMTEARKPTGPVRTEPVSFTVEGKPKGKGRPRFSFKGGHAYTPASTVAYERQIASAARLAMDNHQPMDGPVSVTVRAVFAVSKSWPKAKRQAALSGLLLPTTKPDIDNALKGLMDGCNRVLWIDDVQVVEATITKEYGERPYLHITARPLTVTPTLSPGEIVHAPSTARPNAPSSGHREEDPTPPGTPTG